MYLCCEFFEDYYKHLRSEIHWERASRNTKSYYQIDQIWEELRSKQNEINMKLGRPKLKKFVKLWFPDTVEIIDVINSKTNYEVKEEQIWRESLYILI